MFVTAIETAAQFTRPLHTISRNFGSAQAVPGAATLFFVNSDGWALTCKHVAQTVLASEGINARYDEYRRERVRLEALGESARGELDLLAGKFGYDDKVLAEIYNSFVNCVDGGLEMNIHLHPTVDAALIKFNNFTRLLCSTFPVFAADGSMLKQGRSICRLGFPFPEFRNFEYDTAADQIRWNADPRNATPQFPIEGMVTRLINDRTGTVGFELSTPGLRGQSGGPAFDTDGRIWGMQSATSHLDLDFDVDTDVLRNGTIRRVQDSTFLHVGHCVHVNVLKDFMRGAGVSFQEG